MIPTLEGCIEDELIYVRHSVECLAVTVTYYRPFLICPTLSSRFSCTPSLMSRLLHFACLRMPPRPCGPLAALLAELTPTQGLCSLTWPPPFSQVKRRPYQRGLF